MSKPLFRCLPSPPDPQVGGLYITACTSGTAERGMKPNTVSKHRRALLRDVLALKSRLDTRQAAMDALAQDTEDLIQTHGL